MKRIKALSIILFFVFCIYAFPVSLSGRNHLNTSEENFTHESFFELFNLAAVFDDGDGYPSNAINFHNFNEAFSNFSELTQNHGNYKLAILDSGLDQATWEELDNDYGSYVDIKYYDKDGYSQNINNTEDKSSTHHGTLMTSIAIQCLEREAGNVYADISVFQVFDDDGDLDPQIVEDQLQWIMYLNDHNSDKYKVISMSFGVEDPSTKYFDDEIEELVDDYNCIVVAASGNYASISQQSSTDYEDRSIFPANMPEVFGVGAHFGYEEPSKDTHRLTTTVSSTTNTTFVGSCFSHYVDSEEIDFSEKTVDLVASGYKVAGKCDYFGNGTVMSVNSTGTSVAVPQVAVAAYLASRKAYFENSSDFMNYDRFFACVYQTSENDPDSRNLAAWLKQIAEKAGEPEMNYGTYTIFFSYRVGYGSLDVHDMMEYIEILS